MRSVSVSGFVSMGQCNNGGHGLLSCFLGHSILLDFYYYFRLISPPNARYQPPLKPRDPKARSSVGGRNRHENTAAKRGGWIPGRDAQLAGQPGLSAGEVSRAQAPVCQRLQQGLHLEVRCRCLGQFTLAQFPHLTPSPSRRVCELSILSLTPLHLNQLTGVLLFSTKNPDTEQQATILPSTNVYSLSEMSPHPLQAFDLHGQVHAS